MDIKTKVVWIGCCSWNYGKDTIDIITWDEEEIKVYYDLDNLAADGWEDYENNILYQYFDVNEDLFNILADTILSKPVTKKVFHGPKISNLSTFVTVKNNLTYEIIVDEANYVFIIKTFKGDLNENDEYPYKIIKYLIDGLCNAGFQKIEININEDLEVDLSIHDRDEKSIFEID